MNLPARAVEMEPCLEKSSSFVQRAETQRTTSVWGFPAKERNLRLSMKTAGRQSGKMMSSADHDACVAAELGPPAKAEDDMDATLAGLGALRLKQCPLITY